MTPFCDLRRLGVRLLAPAALAAALLTACGGGTSQVAVFQPTRVLVFGDENSMIVDTENNQDGFKYSINDRSATTAGKCLLLPTFAQSIAAHYGFVFAQCNPNPTTTQAHAFIHAQLNATAADLASQLAAVPDLGPTDMVSVMIGINDIIQLYGQVQDRSLSRGAAVAEAQRRGGLVAEQINRMLGLGARGLVITIPDVGLSPFALAANASNPDAVALMHDLSFEFNAYLRTRIDSTAYDGRNYGLVLADDIVSAMARTPATFLNSPANATVAACTSATITACVITADTATTTLVSGASSSSHLWAGDRYLGPNAHSRIGAQAQSRAANNPF